MTAKTTAHDELSALDDVVRRAEQRRADTLDRAREALKDLPDLPAQEGAAWSRGDDDEADALTLLSVVLERAGAEVETMTSPIAGLERLEVMQPDVLVVDLGMPQMDGFEFIARVRASANPAVRHIPAAALTAFARSEDRTKALRSGFELHLSKPVDPGELAASVATLVRRARADKA